MQEIWSSNPPVITGISDPGINIEHNTIAERFHISISHTHTHTHTHTHPHTHTHRERNTHTHTDVYISI